jgi:hypothetical protein
MDKAQRTNALFPEASACVQIMLCQLHGFILWLVLMSALLELTQRLKARIDLSVADVALATRELSSAQTVDAEKIDFLSALEEKGSTAAEITAFATEFRALSIDPGVGQSTSSERAAITRAALIFRRWSFSRSLRPV